MEVNSKILSLDDILAEGDEEESKPIGNKLPVYSKSINYDLLMQDQRDLGILDTIKKGMSEGIIGNLLDEDPTDNYVPLISQYKTVGEVIGTEQGRSDLAKDALYETSKFASDILAPIAGAAVAAGAISTAGITLPAYITSAIISSFAFGTYSTMSAGAKAKMLGKDTDEILGDMAKEGSIGAATGAVLGPVGDVAGALGKGLFTKAIGGKIAGQGIGGEVAKKVIPVTGKILADEAISTYLGTAIPAKLKGETPTGIDYLNNAITALPMRSIAGGFSKGIKATDVLLSNGQTGRDVLNETIDNYKPVDYLRDVDETIMDKFDAGYTADEIKQSLRINKADGKPWLQSDALSFLDNRIDELAIKPVEKQGLAVQSRLMDIGETKNKLSKQFENITDDQRLMDYDHYTEQAMGFKIDSQKKVSYMLKKALKEKDSDVTVINKFAKSLKDKKFAIEIQPIVKDMLDNVEEGVAQTQSNYFSIPKGSAKVINKHVSKTANHMPNTVMHKLTNNTYGNTARIIKKHLGDTVYDWTVRPAEIQEAASREKIKEYFQKFEITHKSLSDAEITEVANHLLEQQVTRKGESAVTDRTWKGQSENRTYKSYEQMSDAQKAHIDNIRKINEDLWVLENQSRKIRGLEELPPLEGHFPIMKLAEYGLFSDINSDHRVDKLLWKNLEFGRKENKFTKERDNIKNEIMSDPRKVMHKYISYMIRKAYLDPVADRIMDFGKELSRYQPNAGGFIERYGSYIGGNKIDATQGKDVLNWMTNAVVVGRLAGNIGTVLVQASSLAPAIERLGLDAVIKAFEEVVGNPKLIEENRKKSAQLKYVTSDVSIDQTHDFLKKIFAEKYTEKVMGLITYFDLGIREVVWHANYKKALADGFNDKTGAAISEADRQTAMTQGSASRAYQANMYRGAVGKFIGALQSFKNNEIHYIISDVLGLDRAYNFMKHFKSDEVEQAKEYAKLNKYQIHKLDDGSYAVYDKEGVGRLIKGAKDFGVLAAYMALTNLAFSYTAAMTGLPLSSPYADPLDAFWKQKYGITYAQWKAGMTKKGSNKTEKERNMEAGAAILIELTRMLPFVSGNFGPSVGGIINDSERIGRGMRSGNGYETFMGAWSLSGTMGNPFTAPVMTGDKIWRGKKAEAKRYLAAENKKTVTAENKKYHESFIQRYFDNAEREKRKKEAADRKLLRPSSGGSYDNNPMNEYRRMKKDMQSGYKSDYLRMKRELLGK